MKILIISDAWKPQVNGVVNSLNMTCIKLREIGHKIEVIGPDRFKTFPCPSYPSIRLSFFPKKKLLSIINKYKPDSIHIATEGPLGQAARKICLDNKWRFTTSYHTQFPEYIKARIPIPLSISYFFLKRFHSKAEKTLVPTKSMAEKLKDKGFKNIAIWSRGVDKNIFKPSKVKINNKRKKAVYFGRVSPEKNIEAFLNTNLNIEKIVIGDGPSLAKLKEEYPEVIFLGEKFGRELSKIVAESDVFVFPSKTDTFGIVIIEALACGVPVAAYPVTGPKDIIEHEVTGYLSDNLDRAIIGALKINRNNCIQESMKYSWENCSKQFETSLSLIT